MRVAFIGLGQMGSAIAGNLSKAGHQLTLYNRTRSRAEALAANGATVAESPAEAVKNAEVVMTMVADDGALEAVVFGKGGFLESSTNNLLHVSLSTISVALSRKLADAHAQHGQRYVAAPVFGRPEAAAAAKLFVVAAGAPQDIDQCQPLFEAMGQRTFRVGENPPDANVIKVTGNFLITVVIESMAESLSLMRKSGVEPETFLQVMTESIFSAPVYKTYGPMVAENKFDKVGFALRLGLKDNRLVMAAADEASVPLPLGSLVHDRFISAIAQGLSEHDWTAIARGAFQDAGL